jgi:hypothetical protein
MKKNIVHKRITSNKLCESFDYQLCKASTINSNTQENNEWKEETKFHWRFVTCPLCLSMKGLKHKNMAGWKFITKQDTQEQGK